VHERLSKLFRISSELSFQDLLSHQGVYLEKLTEKMDRVSMKPLYSLRVTRAARGIAPSEGDVLGLLSVVPDYDKGYR